MSNTATELEIKISGGRITNVVVFPDGSCKLTVETAAPKIASENFEDLLMLVEASKLSMEDEFMKYSPKTDREKLFKKILSNAIRSGLKDFYRPVLDPSLNDDMSGICYEFGRKPAREKKYNWWVKAAKQFRENCRLGTRFEYVAFLGFLIKKLVESGWSISKAWRAVCVDSKELGHYLNPSNEKEVQDYHNIVNSWLDGCMDAKKLTYCLNSLNVENVFEDTGSREICGFYDLANTAKILAEDNNAGGFWLAGGSCYYSSNDYPLATFTHYWHRYMSDFFDSVGWLVLDCSTDH